MGAKNSRLKQPVISADRQVFKEKFQNRQSETHSQKTNTSTIPKYQEKISKDKENFTNMCERAMQINTHRILKTSSGPFTQSDFQKIDKAYGQIASSIRTKTVIISTTKAPQTDRNKENDNKEAQQKKIFIPPLVRKRSSHDFFKTVVFNENSQIKTGFMNTIVPSSTKSNNMPINFVRKASYRNLRRQNSLAIPVSIQTPQANIEQNNMIFAKPNIYVQPENFTKNQTKSIKSTKENNPKIEKQELEKPQKAVILNGQHKILSRKLKKMMVLRKKLALERDPNTKSLAEKKRIWVGENGKFSKKRLEDWYMRMDTEKIVS